MFHDFLLSLGLLPLLALAITVENRAEATITFCVTDGTKQPVRNSNPIGLSIEFYCWPQWFEDEAYGPIKSCFDQLGQAAGSPIPIRIGGTTSDRATYDPSLSTAVNYTSASKYDAPASLTYGPSFFELQRRLPGREYTYGLNRRLNNLNNTMLAAKQIVNTIEDAYAIELGNEPDLYKSSDPIAGGLNWSQSADGQTEIKYQKAFKAQVSPQPLIQAGNYLQWASSALLSQIQAASTLSSIKTIADHLYPQSACGGAKTYLSVLMSHSSIHSYMSSGRIPSDATAANTLSIPIVMGETNSASCGGGGISPTFGAGMWVADYVFQGVLNGFERLYFHHGTTSRCSYCFFGHDFVKSPWYGAYFASASLNGAKHIAQLDDGGTTFAAYSIYDGSDKLSKIVLMNTKLYGTDLPVRGSQRVQLTKLPAGYSSIKAKRLTSETAYAAQDQGGRSTFAGQTFINGTCEPFGAQLIETYSIENGTATITVNDTEAVLISLSV